MKILRDGASSFFLSTLSMLAAFGLVKSGRWPLVSGLIVLATVLLILLLARKVTSVRRAHRSME